jgi:hypothetical protein
MRANYCDFVTTATQFLIQEACLERGAVGIRDPDEVAEDRDSQGATKAGREGRECREVGRPTRRTMRTKPGICRRSAAWRTGAASRL